MEFATSCRRLANVDDLRNLRYDWRNHQRAPRTAVALKNHERANAFNVVFCQ